MIRNYFKTAFRNLWRNKTFSFLNIFGLAVGISCAALIFLWVEDEVSYNDYFKNKSVLYQVFENQTYDSETYTFAATPGLLSEAMREEIPGIANTTRTSWQARILLSVGDKRIYGNGLYVDSTFISMFTLDFLQGSKTNVFDKLHSIVLSEDMAVKIFNTVDVVGKTLKLDNAEEYMVSGVFRNIPRNTHFGFVEWLVPFEVFFKQNSWLEGWGNNGIQTYAQLDENASLDTVNNKLNGFIQSKSEGALAKPFLLAANDWRLRSNFVDGKQSGGRIKLVKLFSVIAWIILLIACINFMNLATARSEKRAKEVGVRKVMGSEKRMLVFQFLLEALVMTFFSVLVSVIITATVLPAYNNLIGKEMLLDIFKPIHFVSLVAIGLICGLIAGSYPAFYLGSFNPISVLKGSKMEKTGGSALIRKGLVVTQFAMSIIFIICTIVIYQQVLHTKNRELGLNKDNLISMSQQLITMKQEGNMGLRFRTIKNELLSTGYIKNAALSNGSPFQVGSNSGDFRWKSKNPGNEVLISMEWATQEYLNTMGMKILAGRDFLQDENPESKNVVINETFANLITKNKPEEAVGQLIDRNDEQLTVIGVIKDFVYNSVYSAAAPLVIFNDPNADTTSNLTIRFKPGVDYTVALSSVESIIKKYNPEYPFEYKFVDEKFESLFEGESLIGTLASLFAALAIFISCLGLFGLASFIAEQRTKEIGIRKVLGASVLNVCQLLSKDFVLLVFISLLIASPLAYYFMHSWLQNYEYHIHISWWVFASAGGGALFITIVTVSFQAVKAAIANPVKSLRTE